MFLYPLAITLILLALAGKWFDNDRRIYLCVTIFTLAAAILDFIHALPGETVSALHLNGILTAAASHLPLFSLGLGWVCPAAAGLIAGLIWRYFAQKEAAR